MSTAEKLKKRVAKIPRDFTYVEAKSLLKTLGFEEYNKGRTSGSRVRFFRESDGAVVDLHKPHPEKEMKKYAVEQLVEKLREYGELE
ncbi:MAG: type II toxin-antitoxin system HicA family toxin [Lachnospiraceae bacterium]|nr:type II toxin-antitoxin system HicA family toxin [Lachnospiraceae bacterium]